MKKYSKSIEKKQLTALKNTEEFKKIFSKLILQDKNISYKEQKFILLCAILFFNFYNKDKRFKSYFRLAYYIIVKYSLLFEDYKPLYDIGLQIGFYPICDTLVQTKKIEIETISNVITQSLIETKFINEKEGYIETLEQHNSIKSLLNSNASTLVYIAPTSFGKSSLIENFLLRKKFFKIGIIVPTKSLLMQTFKNIKKLNLPYKLILHDEMYNNDEKFIGILTQERAIRLLNKGGKFDILFIDEAHKIFEYNNDNSRGLILSRLIKLNNIKNPKQKVVYLSPLIEDANNLKLYKNEQINSYKITHNLKCEDIYFYDNKKVFLYDKFTGEYLNYKNNIQYFEYIKKSSKDKNFIFHYRPKKIEELANEISKNNLFKDIEIDLEMQNIIDTLKNEVHEDFYINKTIYKGLVYIHAKMPNIIKEYLEYQFSKIGKLKYIIANTVILEGINLPIDNLYIFSTDRQQGKDLVNLIGRVNRLNYVFKEKNLNRLISDVHFINTEKYQGKYDMKNKIKLLREHSFNDELKNPILSEYNIENLKLKKEKKEKREKIDKEILEKTEFLLQDDHELTFKDKIKKYFIENGIDEFYSNLDYIVTRIEKRINFLMEHKNYDFFNKKLIDKIYLMFIKNMEEYIIDFEVERLKNEKAKNYYQNYLDIVQKAPLKSNIINTYKYFNKKANSDEPSLFIGKSFGEEPKKTSKYNSNKYRGNVYIDLSKYKNNKQKLINLAIAKLKIEEDFVNFKLNKLINFLYDFDLIDTDKYNLYIYGTTNQDLIKLSKIGLSVSVINKLISDNQFENISIDDRGNIIINDSFNKYLENQSELFKFEIGKYLY